MRRLAAIAIALAGCATAAPPPKPVVVGERELDALRMQLAGMPNMSARGEAYRVSEVFVDGRVAVLYWEAEVRGEGWRQTVHALCRRCGDDVGWFCARMTPDVLAELPGGATAEVHALAIEDALAAVRFVRDRSPTRRIVRLTGLGGRRICVRFDPEDQLVLEMRNGVFEIESDPARPGWFDSGRSPGMECGELLWPDVIGDGRVTTGCAE